jgi:hypothetical protein
LLDALIKAAVDRNHRHFKLNLLHKGLIVLHL